MYLIVFCELDLRPHEWLYLSKSKVIFFSFLLHQLSVLQRVKNIKLCIATSRELILYDQISTAAEYVGSYIFSWADNKNKPYSIESYSEGAYLNDMYDTRINQLQFTESPSNISDKLCTTIQLWDTTARNDAAQVLAEVWYDQDLDRIKDSSEVSLSFSTIITEK